MFSRRHPFLFSLLVFSALFSATLILVSLIVAIGMRGADLGGLGIDDGEKVGVVEIVGVIAQSRDIIEQLKRFREDDAIRAIVIRVDSPGGVVGPSQEIYREIIRTKADKKVIASMGAVAASGGYYVVAGADGIVAVRFITSMLMQGAAELLVYGTAVKLEDE